MRDVYLDHAATTYLLPEVMESMQSALEIYGNPSGVYSQSRKAKCLVDKARRQVARLLNARDDEIYFTSGGTEADNWAIKGAAICHADKGRHIITSAIEHKAILGSCEYLQGLGWQVDYLQPDGQGIIDPQQVLDALTGQTILVSIMAANNEIGALQPIAGISEICKQAGVLFHTDAVQAVGNIPVDVQSLGVDMLSMSAHKIYGPKGIGALYVRNGVKLDNLLHGGRHERSRRPGTENVPGIAAMGMAARIAAGDLRQNNERLSGLRDRLIEGLLKIPDTRLNGHPTDRLPGNVNVCFAGVESEALLMKLDIAGIAASGGSACSSGSLLKSHVLEAIGVDEHLLSGALRLTLGRNTSMEDIDYVLQTIPGIVEGLRDTDYAYKQLPGKVKLV